MLSALSQGLRIKVYPGEGWNRRAGHAVQLSPRKTGRKMALREKQPLLARTRRFGWIVTTAPAGQSDLPMLLPTSALHGIRRSDILAPEKAKRQLNALEEPKIGQ